MKRVALRGRTSGFAPVMMLTQFPKSPAPIRASIMLLSCWGVALADGRECRGGGGGDNGGGDGGVDDGDGDGDGVCGGGGGGEGEAVTVAIGLMAENRVVRKKIRRNEWWLGPIGEAEKA